MCVYFIAPFSCSISHSLLMSKRLHGSLLKKNKYFRVKDAKKKNERRNIFWRRAYSAAALLRCPVFVSPQKFSTEFTTTEYVFVRETYLISTFNLVETELFFHRCVSLCVSVCGHEKCGKKHLQFKTCS